MQCQLAEVAARRKLSRNARALRKVLPELRTEAVEGIHAARVASRRLRAVIGAHWKVLGETERAYFNESARAITSSLGRARELDVTIALLEARMEKQPIAVHEASAAIVVKLRELRANEHKAIEASVSHIANETFTQGLDAVLASAHTATTCYVKDARRELKKRLRKLWKAQETWQDSETEESLHQVRIAFKKLRYGCEQYSELYGPALKQFVSNLKGVQDELGIWNDVRVAREYASDVFEEAGTAMLPGNKALIDLLESEASEHLAAYERVAETFFSNENRGALKALFDSVRKPCCAAFADATTRENGS